MLSSYRISYKGYADAEDETGCDRLMYRANVYFLDVDQLNFNIPVVCFMVVLANSLENIVINKIAVAAINGKATVVGNVLQSVS
jgi:hypothetical protein